MPPPDNHSGGGGLLFTVKTEKSIHKKKTVLYNALINGKGGSLT